MSNNLHVEETGQSLIIRFGRPEIRSPLSVVVLDELTRIIAEVEKRRDLVRLVFTGTGGVFASGADLREIALINGETAAAFASRGQDLMRRIANLSIETIAAVNGVCFGGALDLALACKRRIASPAALFSHPGANLGIMTGWGGTQRLPRLVGEAIALEMFFTAKRMNAEEALSCGLVDLIVEDVIAAALQL
jgi:enoyl-CoA hydratase/carnithine racemase